MHLNGHKSEQMIPKGDQRWELFSVGTCNTVSPGIMLVNRLMVYETLEKVGVLSLASSTETVTVTGALCCTPSDARSCKKRRHSRKKKPKQKSIEEEQRHIIALLRKKKKK